MLGVTAPTVIKWVESGRLSAHRTPGGHRRIASAEVSRFAVEQGMSINADLKGSQKQGRVARRVLIIDREPDFADMVAEYLQIKGVFSVGHAGSALEAGFHAGRTEPEVILCDVDTVGVEITALRQLVPQARFILLTSIWKPELEPLEADLRAAAVVEKPVKLDELLSIIRG